MTTLIAWLSRDQRNFAALHVASDSRVSWGSSANRWDAGRKIFASRTTPDVWAYSGDVLFPVLVLSQIMSAADAGLLFRAGMSAQERNHIVYNALMSSFSRRHNAVDRHFTIIHAARDGEKKESVPRIWKISFDPENRSWTDNEIFIEVDSGVVAIDGTGTAAAKGEILRWEGSYIGGTSRAIYSAFCSAIASGADPLSGGPPQLASIYPRGSAVTAGVVYSNGLYLHGLPLQLPPSPYSIEWFDSLFQRIDPVTLDILPGAARHAKPKFG